MNLSLNKSSPLKYAIADKAKNKKIPFKIKKIIKNIIAETISNCNPKKLKISLNVSTKLLRPSLTEVPDISPKIGITIIKPNASIKAAVIEKKNMKYIRLPKNFS